MEDLFTRLGISEAAVYALHLGLLGRLLLAALLGGLLGLEREVNGKPGTPFPADDPQMGAYGNACS